MSGALRAAGGLVALALLAALPFILAKGDLHLVAEVFLLIAIAEMWNLLAGYAGLTSLGHQAFIGLGAYFLFYLSNTLRLSPYWLLALTPLFCAAIGALSAIMLFRLRDAYFVIGTWVFSEIVARLISKAPWLGGTSGLSLLTTNLVDLRWFEATNYWIAGAVAFVSVLGSYALLRAPLGLGLMGVRDNELAAGSIGIDVWRARLLVFVLSAAGCGLAGAVYYLGSFYVTTNSAFDIGWVGTMVFIVVVGGMGTLEGPILGTVIFILLREGFSDLLPVSGSWYLVTMGAIAAVTMVVAPRGLWPLLQEMFGVELFAIRRKAPRAAAVAPRA
jgi:branched-chain amino acid transport system permease protein